jgi:hypothetical protein
MNYKTEQALRVKSIALDIIEEIVQDEKKFPNRDLKQSTELLARCICDLVNVYTNITEDHEVTLKGTVIKAKVSYNSLKSSSVKAQ